MAAELAAEEVPRASSSSPVAPALQRPLGHSSAGVFAAAVLTARAAAEVGDVDPDDMLDGVESSPHSKAREAAMTRLEAALEVNRTLHRVLDAKKQQLEASAQGVSLLRARLTGRTVEEPLRRARIEELQGAVQQAEPTSQRAARDAAMLGREGAKLEARIMELNAANLALADKHREERVQVTEKQNKLRILGKRERELAKHLDFMSSSLNEAAAKAAAVAARDDWQEDAATDYTRLPGLCVGKLVGRQPQRAPPGGKPSGGRAPPGGASPERDRTRSTQEEAPGVPEPGPGGE